LSTRALPNLEQHIRILAESLPAIVFVADRHGHNIYTNGRFQSFTGLEGETLLGERWLQVLHPDDRARAASIWMGAIASGEPYEAEYRFRRRDGQYRWFLCRALPARDEAGNITDWYGTGTDIDDAKCAAQVLSEETRTLETLNRVGRVVSAELDVERAVQKVTDTATDLIGAAFGAFFYNARNEFCEAYRLYTLSGASRAAFEHFSMPRNTAVFGPTFRGESVVRSDDITQDPRYGHNAPHHGMPQGHLSVRSYLAVPVISRLGEVLGGLLFGHPNAGVFSERTERLAVSIAAHAAIAIDNARLYEAAQRQIAERTRIETALRESERRLNAVLDNATVAVLLMDCDRSCSYMNAAAERLTGYSLEQTQGRRLHELIHHSRPDGSPYPVEDCPIDQHVLQNEQQQGEEVFVHRDGSFYPVAFTSSPIRDEHARVIGTIVEVRDIRAEREAAEQLREADRRKDEFLAVLAHELRNPLAPLRNGLEILRPMIAGNPIMGRVTDMMGRQVTHLVRLVDDLLDLNRITRGRLELRREPVLLREAVNAAVEASRSLIDAHEHELIVHLADDQLTVDGDVHRLAQVISNLLSNSAKYTPDGGRITLTLERRDDNAVMSVTDTGIGIPPGSLAGIFEMFSQVHSGRDRSEGGLGIGLALVRSLVQMHGGTVTAHSDGLGTGSRFTIRLPALVRLDSRELIPSAVGASAKTVSVVRRRVLIADDNEDAASSLTLWLQQEGHEVCTANDGHQAVVLAESFRPEVILMDLGMPRLDGLEASRKIRSQPWGKAIRIIALTGWGREQDRVRTQHAGIDLHWVKPVDPHALSSILAVEPSRADNM
jgi:PAS domain S-box-containing protein